jgi:hypothetical protein
MFKSREDLRDYLAGQMIATAYEHALDVSSWQLTELFGDTRGGMRREEIAAAVAYRCADAMLARRARPVTGSQP